MIVVLVEGDGDRRALPILVQRHRGRSGIRCIDMHGKSNIVRRYRGFEETVRRQHEMGGKAFLVLLDGDVTYPPYKSLSEEMSAMQERAQALASELNAPVHVCWAVLAMESWLIGGIAPKASYCSLRQVAKVPANTETAPSQPKRWLEEHLEDDYLPRIQECLAHNIDLPAALTRNRSFQSFLETAQQVDPVGKT